MKSIWIFGGVERDSRKIVAEIVSDRKVSTLLEVIKKHIHQETFIISDGWKGYFKLNEWGYDHLGESLRKFPKN